MARRKVPMGLIASQRVRAATYAKRKEGLRKKAQELATLCDVPVALVCDDGGEGRAEVWESREGVLAAYRALPSEARAGHTLRAYAEAELGKEEAKLARVRQAGPPALAPWDAALDGYSHEDLRRLLASIDAALRAVGERRRALGLPLDDDDVGSASGGLLEGVASDAVPLARAAPCAGADFANGADGYHQHAPGGGVHADDGRYRQAMWGDGFLQPCHAVMVQPGYGFHQCTTSSVGGVDMDGYQLQIASDVYGTTSSNNGRRLTWEDFQPRNAGAMQPGYSLQCAGSSYAAMDGYRTQQGPGVHPNLAMWSTGEPCNAILPAGHPSLDIGLSYMDTPAGQHAAVGIAGRPLAMGAGGNFTNAPPALSLAMGTGDDFASAPPALLLTMSFGGDVTNPGSYVTRWPDRQLQLADSSQQSSLEQLHYLSDLDDPQLHYLSDIEDAQLQLWGANPPPMPAPHHSSNN